MALDKNLIQRSITGALFVAVVVGAVWFSVWTMAGLLLLIAALGLHEFYGLAEKANVHPQKFHGITTGVLILICTFLFEAQLSGAFLLPLIPLITLTFIFELYRQKENPFGNIAWTLLGILYIILPTALLIAQFVPSGLMLPNDMTLQVAPYDHRPLLTFFILIWTSDTLAYVCGRLFGKHKLFERISPKKTWEGFVGGFIFTMGAGALIAHYFFTTPVSHNVELKWSIIAGVIAITGVLGDLSESLFKRSINIKDSGTILPGHGGILDRFDAFFISIPFAMTAYWICENIFHMA